LSVTISLLDDKDITRWNAYVKQHQEGTFFHLAQWKSVITASFQHKPFYLIAKQAEQVVGVLPLVEVNSVLFGHALISTPFCVYGGALADCDDIKHQLEQYAIQLSEQLAVDYLELRYITPQQNNLLCKQAHATFQCELADTDEDILLKVRKKQRAVIRHALKNNLSGESTTNLDDFYQLLSESYRNLGTPIFSKKYFKNLMETFKNECDIRLIKDESGKPSTAVLNFYFNDTVLPYYGGGNANSRYIKSADLMYYQVMCDARKKGFTRFDFGRSKIDSGPYHYKKNWGMEPITLHYYYHLVKAESLPNLSPNNPKYQLFIALWKKLPLKVSQIIGPFLSKYLG
jgi:FemAB-related protein (PEP-CTERM system-associated)